MKTTRARRSAAIIALACAGLAAPAFAQDKTIKIGVLNDMSSLYADIGGPGSTAAAKLAVADFAKSNPNVKVELVSADHQNKVDIGIAITRRWLERESVDMIIDVPNSAIALGVNTLARDLNKVFIASGAGTADLTGKACSPNTVHWTYDTWELGHSIAKAVFARGGNSWYFITADYTFGKDLEASASEEVTRLGGKVLGSARVPLGASDFSSFLLQAQSAKPKVIALANAGVSLKGLVVSAGVPLTLASGIVMGLVLGKPVGIILAARIAVSLGWCALPEGVGWRHIGLLGCLGGIGFTMSIFIADLAFRDPLLLEASKFGVLLASTVAAIAGLVVGRLAPGQPPHPIEPRFTNV